MKGLTEVVVARLAVPDGKKEHYAWDKSLPGFGVRMQRSGAKAYCVKYALGDQQRKLSLGPALPGSLAETRKKAQQLLAEVRLGRDPVGEKRAAKQAGDIGQTTKQLVDRYMQLRRTQLQRDELSPRSYEEIDYHLRRLFAPLHDRAPADITRRDISDLVDDLAAEKGNRTADNFKTSASAFFVWLLEKELIGANPAANIKRRSKKGPRQRFLAAEEIGALWHATELPTEFNQIFRLILLTAARREEIGELRWSEIDLNNRIIRLPKTRHKTGRKLGVGKTIMLSEPAAQILAGIPRRAGRDNVFGRGEGGFSGWTRAKQRLDCALADRVSEHWSIHDLRRSFSTHVMDQGLGAMEVKDAALGHAKKSIEGTYNVSKYDQQRRALMERWAEFVFSSVASIGMVSSI